MKTLEFLKKLLTPEKLLNDIWFFELSMLQGALFLIFRMVAIFIFFIIHSISGYVRFLPVIESIQQRQNCWTLFF